MYCTSTLVATFRSVCVVPNMTVAVFPRFSVFPVCYHHHHHHHVINFMQGIYNYVLETTHVSGVYNVTYSYSVFTVYSTCNVISFPVISGLYFHVSTFRSTCVVPNMVIIIIIIIIVVVVVVVVVVLWNCVLSRQNHRPRNKRQQTIYFT
jgi:hypothetical protein